MNVYYLWGHMKRVENVPVSEEKKKVNDYISKENKQTEGLELMKC